MRLAITVYRLGALSLLFAGGVFFEEPLHSALSQNHNTFLSLLLLYGLPVLAGFSFLALSADALKSADKRILHLCNGIAVVSFTWLLLWVSMWVTMTAFPFPLSLVHLLGIGAAMAFYTVGWKRASVERALWFLMSSGWSLAYMGGVNLFLQPHSRHLWGDLIGGLFVLTGSFSIRGEMRGKRNFSSINGMLY